MEKRNDGKAGALFLPKEVFMVEPTVRYPGIPLEFKRSPHGPQDDITIVAGDIGGTKTNLAVYHATSRGMDLVREQRFASRDYPSFEAIIRAFLSGAPSGTIDRICLGIAGPVLGGKVQTTNLAWTLDSGQIAQETGIRDVGLINDLEATSYGLAGLQPAELLPIHKPETPLPGCGAVLAPGTGLGEGGLFWTGKGYLPIPTEGGHSEFFPRSSMDVELYQWLAAKFGVVSWERLISGPGLTNIYRFLREELHMEEPAWLAPQVDREDAGAAITQNGLSGAAPICQEALRHFVRFMAEESTSLVLKYKASGGLFLAGGIPPRLVSLI
ncbi:MAG TPA: glucokinase, partial [Chitinophagaceae bacterium]|nr:glucokinase [Chitinophagaceae bacterium]